MYFRVLACAVLFVLSGCSTGRHFTAQSPSMVPAIGIGDVVFVSKFDSTDKPVERFDIIVFRAPPDEVERAGGGENLIFTQRVIGLPGETIELRRGTVFVNGTQLDEPFKVAPSNSNFGPISIPIDEYFLMGDNRDSSNDGRIWKKPTVARSEFVYRVNRVVHRS